MKSLHCVSQDRLLLRLVCCYNRTLQTEQFLNKKSYSSGTRWASSEDFVPVKRLCRALKHSQLDISDSPSWMGAHGCPGAHKNSAQGRVTLAFHSGRASGWLGTDHVRQTDKLLF